MKVKGWYIYIYIYIYISYIYIYIYIYIICKWKSTKLKKISSICAYH